MQRKYLSVQELAKELNLAESTLYHWVKRGKVPVHRPDAKTIMFDRQRIENWLRENKVRMK
ncbi:MAG TPA: hypothetical protein DCE71_07915 [Parachlamydiales bacterium]|nr:hypothetical protein [Parachlamydiales bacterium]